MPFLEDTSSIITNPFFIFFIAFLLATTFSFLLAPVFRWIAIRYNILDHPSSNVKTHHQSTPYLGGCAIALAFVLSLTISRCLSNYIPGLLRPIQGIFFGGFLVFLLGLVDDIIIGGLSYKKKFLIQIAASSVLLFYGIHIQFIQPRWLAFLLTIIWVTGIMNAVNIIDIMDGLAGGTTLIAALAFLFISLPTEQFYVNLTASALAGACFGFLPYNFSKNQKMFMGDTGSLFIGYVLASLSLGTSYTTFHNAGVLAPILILGVPLYDTLFVMYLRYKKGMSPFLGSKDHFALRLEKMGLDRAYIVSLAIYATLFLSTCAWLTTIIWFWWAIAIYALVIIVAISISYWLAKVKID